ncbi:MAG: transglutaminase domain-containing protein, partial [Firmicutes bacterium]|nr:transglutaminase domain-containing protein [Bacillota bacterium]
MVQTNHLIVPPKTKILALERVIDACSCFLLATGLLNALFKLFDAGPSHPWAFIIFPAFFLLLYFFFCRPLLIALGLVASLLLIYCSVKKIPFFVIALDYILWWVNGYEPPNITFAYNYFIVIRLLLAAGCTLILWFSIRRAPFWILLIGCPLVVAVLAYFGLRGFVTSMYLLAAGLIPLAAAATLKHNRKWRGIASAYALGISVVLLLLVFILMPADTSSFRWQPLGDKVEEWREDARIYYWGWRNSQGPQSAFDLSVQYNARLGGPVVPTKTRMLLVNTNMPLLLKGSVYDYYTGYGWSKVINELEINIDDMFGFIEGIPFLDENSEKQLEQILGTIPQPESEHPLAPYVQSYSAHITLLHPNEQRLFYGGRPLLFATEEPIEPIVDYGSEITSRLPLLSGYRYEINGLALNRDNAGFADSVADVLQSESYLVKQPNRNMWIYYQLPLSMILDNSFLDILKLVKNIANKGLKEGESRNPYEEAVLLEKWLNNNCTYTMTPQMPSYDKDFFIDFLETKEGYCTYFATAMVIMARMLNIPARYVTGYALSPIVGINQYEATQATAHAWAELFFDGVGWLTFDPTNIVFEETTTTINIDPYSEPQHWATWGAPENNTSPAIEYRSLGLAALAIAAFLFICFIIVVWRACSAFSLTEVLKRFSLSTALDIYYHDMLGQLA